MQPAKQLRERSPVVKHQIAHPQEGQLLQPASACATPDSRFSNAVKGLLVVPLQGILA